MNEKDDLEISVTEAANKMHEKMLKTQQSIRERSDRIKKTYEKLTSEVSEINESLAQMQEDNTNITELLDQLEKNRREVQRINNFHEKLKDKNYLSDKTVTFSAFDYGFNTLNVDNSIKAIENIINAADINDTVKFTDEIKQYVQDADKKAKDPTKFLNRTIELNKELQTEKSAQNVTKVKDLLQKTVSVTELVHILEKTANDIIEIKKNVDSNDLAVNRDYIESCLYVDPKLYTILAQIRANKALKELSTVIYRVVGEYPCMWAATEAKRDAIKYLERLDVIINAVNSKISYIKDETDEYRQQLISCINMITKYKQVVIDEKRRCDETIEGKFVEEEPPADLYKQKDLSFLDDLESLI